MNLHSRKSKFILILSATVLAVTSVIVVAAVRDRAQKRQQETLPVIISRVRNLEVVSATIKKQGESGAVIALEIRNNSDKPIIAIAIESGDGKDAAGVSTDGFKSGDEPPSVILPSHGTIMMEIAVSNLLSGKPLKIAGVMYADETEDGDELARKTIRGHKEMTKAKGSAKKGEPQG